MHQRQGETEENGVFLTLYENEMMEQQINNDDFIVVRSKEDNRLFV